MACGASARLLNLVASASLLLEWGQPWHSLPSLGWPGHTGTVCYSSNTSVLSLGILLASWGVSSPAFGGHRMQQTSNTHSSFPALLGVSGHLCSLEPRRKEGGREKRGRPCSHPHARANPRAPVTPSAGVSEVIGWAEPTSGPQLLSAPTPVIRRSPTVPSCPTSCTLLSLALPPACVLKSEEAKGRTLISWGLVFISRVDAANTALTEQLPQPPPPAPVLPLPGWASRLPAGGGCVCAGCTCVPLTGARAGPVPAAVAGGRVGGGGEGLSHLDVLQERCPFPKTCQMVPSPEASPWLWHTSYRPRCLGLG